MNCILMIPPDRQEHPEDKKLLEEVSSTCTEMQARVVELIGVVENRELTSILLGVNDKMNNQLLRFERYNNNMEGKATATGYRRPVHRENIAGSSFRSLELIF